MHFYSNDHSTGGACLCEKRKDDDDDNDDVVLGNDDTGPKQAGTTGETTMSTTISTSDVENEKTQRGDSEVQNPWILVDRKQVNKKRQNTEE